MGGIFGGDAPGDKVGYASPNDATKDGYFLEATLKSPGRAFAMTLQSVASRIDLTDGYELPINFSPGVNFVTGLTLSASKDIFGVSRIPSGGGFANQLFRVDPSTGLVQGTPVLLNLGEPTDVQGLELIGVNPDRLFVLNTLGTNTQSLHVVNSNGQSQSSVPLHFVAPFQGQPMQLVDLAYDPTGLILYGWDRNTGLVQIDQNTGAVIDTISFSGGPIDAIAFDDKHGKLYGISSSGLYEINTTNEQDVLISDPNIYGDFGDFVILDDSFYRANLLYGPGKRNVELDPRDGVMTGFKISTLDLLAFDLSALVLPPWANVVVDATSLTVTGLDQTGPLSIGEIFPPDLGPDELAQYLFQYMLADGVLRDGETVYAQIPEPGTGGMMLAVALLLGCGRRRRWGIGN